jgi:predicted RecA/RadA family phage recombinase
MRTFSTPGDTIVVTASRTAAMDAGMLVGAGIFGITQQPATNGQPVPLRRTGVFIGVPKATGQAWTLGALIYWDNTNFVFTTTASGNSLRGSVMAAAASGDTVGSVLLDGVAR